MNVHSMSLPGLADGVRHRRAELFRETWTETIERWALGTAWTLKGGRMAGLPPLARMWVSHLISPGHGLPDPEASLEAPLGLCGMVGDLSAPTLIQAYHRGLFTFAHFGPLKWYSLPERCVLFFDEMHVGKTLRRDLRQAAYRVTFDSDFEGVIKACAGRRDGKWHVTWITPRIMRLYAELYDAGYVHSFEVWNGDGSLVGGGYGVALGNIFFTESQFSLERNTSKIGFTALNWHLTKWGYRLNDGKWATPTITAMGFRTIARSAFLAELATQSTARGKSGRWEVEADLATIAAAQQKKPAPSRAPEPLAV